MGGIEKGDSSSSAGSRSGSSASERSAALAERLLGRKWSWLWPALAIIVHCVIGWELHTRMEAAIKTTMAGQLHAILDADVAALRLWLHAQQASAQAAADGRRAARLAERLIERSHEPGVLPLALAGAPEAAELREALAPAMRQHGYLGFLVADRARRTVAASQDALVGTDVLGEHAQAIDRVLAGESIVAPPFPSEVLLPDEQGRMRANLPTMFAAAPIRDEQKQVIGLLLLRMRPADEFTRILNVARFGQSGETFAFDRSGLLLSQSRFDDELKHLGLLPDRQDATSVLNLALKDPGADLTSGERPAARRDEQLLIRLAAEAAQHQSGVDVDGYRDYRGVPVIGAWTWLSEYGFGVGTEVDRAEAYRSLAILKIAFWVLFVLLLASALAIFGFTIVLARLRRSMRQAAIEARQLGQYSLEEKIGAGGMGVVYRGRHAMLRRPTAIKLLDADKTTEQAISRFEREVHLTSQLNHPNTIAIYDYGRTPEGVFYYAMEYLDGINLDELVRRHGPLPEGRVIAILRQICGSRGEAHGIGLIHRDIKPANIVLCQRGGQYDVVKVLDFGLVKAIDAERQTTLTSAGAIAGTPHYLAPEAIEGDDRLDARSDLYAVGAVGYFLLTGTPVFQGKSVAEVCMQQVYAEPERPSSRVGRTVSQELESLIMACLAKDPGQRPGSAEELAERLAECPLAGTWSRADATAWWREHDAAMGLSAESTATDDTEDTRTVIFRAGGERQSDVDR
ncbi:MAG TPA: serine/threonine protein kinase [Pirellulales bacterium]|nr:serine/threonine protein kinase [Pirellulales bacterium]